MLAHKGSHLNAWSAKPSSLDSKESLNTSSSSLRWSRRSAVSCLTSVGECHERERHIVPLFRGGSLNAQTCGWNACRAAESVTNSTSSSEIPEDHSPKLQRALDTLSAELLRQGSILAELRAQSDAHEKNLRRVLELLENTSSQTDSGATVAISQQESQRSETAWSEDEMKRKLKLIGQIRAEDLVEGVRLLTPSQLAAMVDLGLSSQKISDPEAEVLLGASVIADGMDLEPLHLVADVVADVAPNDPREHAIQEEDVERLLHRAAILARASGTQVLPVMIGQSVTNEVARSAGIRGVAIICRSQNELTAVF